MGSGRRQFADGYGAVSVFLELLCVKAGRPRRLGAQGRSQKARAQTAEREQKNASSTNQFPVGLLAAVHHSAPPF